MSARAGLHAVVPVWLATSALLLLAFGYRAWILMPSDSDDFMRLLEVRDWLGGQSWWDVSQHRMDPPHGVPMHWSRLVDLPIAAVILLFAPFGRVTAEALALEIVPLLTLAALMIAVAALTRRLVPNERAAPPLAAGFVGTSFFLVLQLFPGRIDHHGWQLVANAIALLGLFDPRAARGGVIAGAALAIGLAVSLEGLPFAAALGAVAGLRWVTGDAGDCRRFAGLTLALAMVSLALFAATRPMTDWFGPWCDVMAPRHLAALAVVGLGGAVIGLSPKPMRPSMRLAALGSLGLVASAAYIRVPPACPADPFGGLDPLVRRLWYLNVLEGQPVWRQSIGHQVQMLWLPLLGLAGIVVALRRPGTDVRGWQSLLVLLLAATAVGLVVRRAIGTAEVTAIPGAVSLMLLLVRRARAIAGLATRTVASAAAMLLPTPLTALYAQLALQPAAAAADGGATPCDKACALDRVATLPPSDMLTPIDLAAPLLAHTRGRVVAGPYHRADAALNDVIRAYTGAPEIAHAIVRRRRLRYVLAEPGSGEAFHYRRLAPDGLMARLMTGRAPAWLRPVPLGEGPIRTWRVVG